SSKVAPETSAEESREELLRQSRLQVSEYDIDDFDDGSLSQEQIIYNTHFKRGETETIRKVLNETELIALKQTSGGFNEVNFSLGVINCFLITYIIGAHPEHLWLLYVVESFYMIPRKFYNMWHAKPLNEALYYLDFCWCMNFLAIFLLVVLAFSEVAGINVESGIREILFKASLGVACGVLLAANIALPFVACLFHDVNAMTGFFIHFVPPLVTFTFMWDTDAIISSWPNVFDFSYLGDIRYFGGVNSVAGCATSLYLMWWIFYTSFMLLAGLNLPKKFKLNGQEANPKWDTVFHSTMRQGVCISIGKTFRGRPRRDSLKQMEENDFDLIDFFIYMAFHLISSLTAVYTIGYGCFSYKYFHLSVLSVSAVLAVVRGAKRYTYYSTKMYSRTLRKRFAHIMDGDDGKEGYSQMS
ncbi:hypothetical protein ACHAXR_002141, partial [Thalassiosira sp. AJA248-18]